MVMTAITFASKGVRFYMSLLGNDKKQELSDDLIAEIDEQLESPINHNSVLDYMLELSDEDYDKLLKSAKVYREANRKVAGIMGVPDVAAQGEKVEVRIEKSDDPDFIPTGNPQDMIDHAEKKGKQSSDTAN